MQKDIANSDIARRAARLAFGKTNDIVKLLFLEPGERDQIDAMNLGLVSEVKRSDKGAIEVKLVNRLDILKFIAGLLSEAEDGVNGAAGFFAAIDKAAERLGEREGEI